VWRGQAEFQANFWETCNSLHTNKMQRPTAQETLPKPYPKSQPL